MSRPLLFCVSLFLAVATSPAFAASPVALDLQRAFALAREHSYALAIRGDELKAAKAREWQSFARLLPRLTLGLRYARLSYVEPAKLTLPIQLPNQPAPPSITLGESIEEQIGSSLILEQPLFTGGALLRSKDAAGYAVDGAAQRLRQEEQELALRVEEAYFGLLKAQQLGEVAQSSLTVLTAHLERLERLAKEGVGTQLDVSRAKARLATTRVQQLQAQAAEGSARLGLALLLGLDPDTQLRLTEEPVPRPAAPMEQLVASSRGRPDLEAARAGALARDAQAGAAAGALWPQLLLRGSMQYDNPNSRYFPARDEFNHSWDAAVVMSWSFWDWGLNWSAQRAAAYEASAARRQVQLFEEAARIEVERRGLEATTSQERIFAAQQGVLAAEQALRRAQNLCEAGQSACFVVLDAESELTRIRSELVQARADARVASTALWKAAGALTLDWESP